MIVLVLIFLAFAAFVGLVMEIYKKSIRKDKASVWEIRGVAFALSDIFGTVAWLITDAHMLAEMLKDTVHCDSVSPAAPSVHVGVEAHSETHCGEEG